MASPLDLQRGLWLRIPGLQWLKANIRWKRASMIGCEFESRLHLAVFDHLMHQANSGPGGLPARMWSA